MTTDAASKPINMRWAITHALDEEMARDERVCLIGQDIGPSGGTFGLTRGLYDTYGPRRVRDAPISEEGLVDLAVGAAINGLRPVVEIMFMDFMTLVADALINQAAKTRYLSGGELSAPLVVRTLASGGFRAGAHHSQSLEALFAGIPGLRVVSSSNAADAKGLLKSAIRCDDPVVVLESKGLFSTKSVIPEGDHLVPLGTAAIARPGRDVTVVAWGRMVGVALAAADAVAADGIDAEVIDLRSLLPIDHATVIDAVTRTSRLVVVQEAPKPVGVGAEVAAFVAEQAIDVLDAPIARVAGAFSPIPIGLSEDLLFPNEQRVADAIRRTVEG